MNFMASTSLQGEIRQGSGIPAQKRTTPHPQCQSTKQTLLKQALIEGAAELPSMLLCDGVFFPQQIEDCYAGLA
jgi:hypothetical protein